MSIWILAETQHKLICINLGFFFLSILLQMVPSNLHYADILQPKGLYIEFRMVWPLYLIWFLVEIAYTYCSLFNYFAVLAYII